VLCVVAPQNELNEPFLWLPNLEGPTYGAAPAEGMAWLTKNWDGLTPPLGWHDTIAFLTVPLILIVSQSISQKLLQPEAVRGVTRSSRTHFMNQWDFASAPDGLVGWLSLPASDFPSVGVSLCGCVVAEQKPDDPAAQSQWILKFLPFMVGYFSLNVPSGLGVYWIINNFVTTLTTYVTARLCPFPAVLAHVLVAPHSGRRPAPRGSI
jgi:YidC/Oxa1 family membrane protein insertase